jgi:hypothetical protein
MENIFALMILASLVLLIIGFVSPKTSLFWDKGERTKKRSALIYGISLIVCFILFGVTTDEKASTTSQVNSTADSKSVTTEIENVTEAESVSSQPVYNKMGDQIEVGNFSYVINSAKFAKSIGNEFSRQTADGIYLIVNMTFRNNDKEEHTLDNSFFKLSDENGTEFQSSTEGETALEMSGQETLFLKQCNPHITKSGLLIFEVPDKKVYDLHLSGGFWNGETAVVKLTTK